MRGVPTTNTISRALFEADPMHTCCAENACFDEYDRVAAGAVTYLENGYTLPQALHKALRDWFGLELAGGRDLSPVLASIELSTDLRAADSEWGFEDEIGDRKYKEYYLTFSNKGSIKVRVKFEKSTAQLADMRMQPQNITALIDPETGDFITAMTFDDHLFELTRVDLSLARKTLTIHARQPREMPAEG